MSFPHCRRQGGNGKHLRFASRLNDTLIATGKTNIKGLYLLWNMVDGREKSELYKVYEQVIGELGLKVLNTFLPDSKRFRRELTGNIGHCSVPRCFLRTVRWSKAAT